jgi:predicted DNA-binding transcriptional regulator AlpA
MPDTPFVRIVPTPDTTLADPIEAPRDRPEAGQTATVPAGELLPLRVDMAGLSRLLARSEASLDRDDSAGRIPAGRKLGGSKRWVYSEIVAWVEAGMPDRRTWELMKGAKNATSRPRQAGR